MDNSNLREEQLQKLSEAVKLIDVSANYLTKDQIKARGILNEAQKCIQPCSPERSTRHLHAKTPLLNGRTNFTDSVLGLCE